jgi:hypothetical protein
MPNRAPVSRAHNLLHVEINFHQFSVNLIFGWLRWQRPSCTPHFILRKAENIRTNCRFGLHLYIHNLTLGLQILKVSRLFLIRAVLSVVLISLEQVVLPWTLLLAPIGLFIFRIRWEHVIAKIPLKLYLLVILIVHIATVIGIILLRKPASERVLLLAIDRMSCAFYASPTPISVLNVLFIRPMRYRVALLNLHCIPLILILDLDLVWGLLPGNEV